ncbi:hypothetical protein HJFPF1_12494 [Paramyrothecium foliicola]|nr:hypothetical protein HJFPF1_12494 [Paramyrothecium foliicola]
MHLIPGHPHRDIKSPVEACETQQCLTPSDETFSEEFISAKSRRATRSGWDPFWVSTPVMATFATAFTLMLLATALLYYFSEKHLGISTPEQKYHYSWKYGPTAEVLLITSALWQQVDYVIKVSMPWVELQKKPTERDKALTLNYVSVSLPTSLYMALINRHWAVMLSTAGQCLIIATMVFSTALLVLVPIETTTVRSDISLPYVFKIREHIAQSSHWTPGSSATLLFYGIHVMDLTYPMETSNDTVTTGFILPDDPMLYGALDLTFEAEALKIGFECDVLPITPSQLEMHSIKNQENGSHVFLYDVNTPDCKINGAFISAPSFDTMFDNPPDSWSEFLVHFDWYICNTGDQISYRNNYNSDTSGNSLVKNTDQELRLLLPVSEVRHSRYNRTRKRYESHSITNITAVLCEPSYHISEFEIYKSFRTKEPAYTTKPTNLYQQGRQLSGFSNATLGMAVWSTIRDYRHFQTQAAGGFFNLMSTKSGRSEPQAFLDANLLIETASSVFKGVATQLMRQIAVQEGGQECSGRLTIMTDRLRVTLLSTISMCISLGVLAIISICISFRKPRPNVPFAPDTIASMAKLISDGQFAQKLSSMKPLSDDRIDEWPREKKWMQSGLGEAGRGKTASLSQQDQMNERLLGSSKKKEWWIVSGWKPLSGTSWYFFIAISLPAAAVAALETFYYLLKRPEGFIYLNPYTAIIFSNYIPVLFAFSISAIYSGLEFTVKLIMPFSALEQGKRKGPAAQTLEINLMGKLSPVAAYVSYKLQNYAVITAILASSIGGLLSVVVSGLYTTTDAPRPVEFPILLKDTIDTNLTSFGNLQDALVIASLIEFRSLNQSKWTYDDVVFNQLDPYTISAQDWSNSQSLVVKIPAIRPRLNCTVVEVDKVLMSKPVARADHSGKLYLELATTLSDSDWCEIPLRDNSPYFATSSMVYTLESADKRAIIGNINTHPMGSPKAGYPTIEGRGCPTLSVHLGWARAVKSTAKSALNCTGTDYDIDLDMGMILCYQQLEKVAMTVNLTLPDFDVDPRYGGQIDEFSATSMLNQDGGARFDFNLDPLAQGLINPDFWSEIKFKSRIADTNNSLTTPNVEKFVRSATEILGLSIDGLLGKNKTSNLFHATNRLYKRYMVQVMSMHMRTNSIGDEAPSITYDGVITLNDSKRLHQDSASKLLLQAMLGVMIICALITRSMLPSSEALPCNPCSIIGTASLLVGGSLVARPHGSQSHEAEMKPESLSKAQGRTYSLKWWQSADGRFRYGIDVDKT